MSEKIKTFALGGLDEDGKNLQVIEIDRDIFIVEAGIKYPNKSTPGIDYIIPSYQYLKDNKDRVAAYILCHGHDDEIGATAYIYQDVVAPIYCSNVTATMLKGFTQHAKLNPDMYQFNIVLPTSTVTIKGHKVNFFHTSHNIAESFGFAIETSLGNIVFTSDYIVENNASANYLHDLNALALIAEKPTLMLMVESQAADSLGYTAPKHKVSNLIAQTIKDAPGRTFVAMFSPHLFNIDEVIAIATQTNKKIICYDKDALSILTNMQAVGQLLIPKNNYAPIDDINRLRAQDIIVLICAYGAELYKKIALLSSNEQDDKRIQLNESDTFIVAAPPSANIEIAATDAVNELYRSGVNVLNISKKVFATMHASEEDIKSMISLLKPKYYVPVKGAYRKLLANAQLAVGMGIKLNHQNVFILDNGMILEINENGSRIRQDTVAVGDLLIDGLGIGDVSTQVISDRQKLSDDGVVVLALTVSKLSRSIVAGPDVQMRGFVFVKDADTILKEITRILVSVVESALKETKIDMEACKQTVHDKCLRQIKKETAKMPMVLPLIVEVD